MTAVDLDALDKLRTALARKLTTWVIGVAYENAWNCADVLVELPEVVELLAEVRRGRALREAVEGLAEEWAEMARDHDEQGASNTALVYAAHARHLRAVVAAVDGGEQ